MVSQVLNKVKLLHLVEPATFVRRVNVKLKNDWNEGQWAEKRFIVNHDYRFIYCPIFKNASTSMLSAILSISHCRRKEALLSGSEVTARLYVDLNYSLASYPYARARQILDGNYFKFVIVRNPWARIASAYCNFFVRSLQKGRTSEFAKDVSKFIHGDRSTLEDAQAITFEHLVAYVCATEDRHLNKHCLPQHLFMGDTQFDHIIRMESLDIGLAHVCDKLGLPLKLPEINKTKYVANQGDSQSPCYAETPAHELAKLGKGLPDYRAFYTPHLIDLVRERYDKSIHLFDYDFA